MDCFFMITRTLCAKVTVINKKTEEQHNIVRPLLFGKTITRILYMWITVIKRSPTRSAHGSPSPTKGGRPNTVCRRKKTNSFLLENTKTKSQTYCFGIKELLPVVFVFSGSVQCFVISNCAELQPMQYLSKIIVLTLSFCIIDIITIHQCNVKFSNCPFFPVLKNRYSVRRPHER